MLVRTFLAISPTKSLKKRMNHLHKSRGKTYTFRTLSSKVKDFLMWFRFGSGSMLSTS